MKILFAASEGVPFIKTGGLGDVIGSLPLALQKLGLEVRVILPRYRSIPSQYLNCMEQITTINVPLSWRNQKCTITRLNHGGIVFYFLDNDYYFDRPTTYNHFDEAERFAFFSRAILEALPYLDFQPEIIHCHDWHTGLVSVYLDKFYKGEEAYQNISTIYTIHNLKFQGVFPKETLGDVLGLEDSYFSLDKLEFNGQVSFMKGGLVFSDFITTVSNTYAQEIKYPYFGEGLDGLLKEKEYKLAGILNGLDYDEYNPGTDPNIYFNYSDDLGEKLLNKIGLQKELGLPVDKDIPLLAMVSRLTDQKGLGLLVDILDELLDLNIQLVILGCGDRHHEEALITKAMDNNDKLSENICFSEPLARKIYAGADIFLMPSLYEPCGLSQLIALRYGTIPIVREVGGLRDTIIPYSGATMEGNGFSFKNYSGQEFLGTIKSALELYKDKSAWPTIVKNALRSDYSWQNSAKAYKELYKRLVK